MMAHPYWTSPKSEQAINHREQLELDAIAFLNRPKRRILHDVSRQTR